MIAAVESPRVGAVPFVRAPTDALRMVHDFVQFTVEQKEKIMGKYVLGWILGVPAVVLVLIYIFMH